MSSGQASLENVTVPDTAHDLAAPPSNVDTSRPKTPPQNDSNLQLPANTPQNRKQAGNQLYTSTHIGGADARKTALGKETVGYIVGPMPIETFLDAYVPQKSVDVPFVQAKANEMQLRFREIIIKSGEDGMYQEWVSIPCCNFPQLPSSFLQIDSMGIYTQNCEMLDVHTRELTKFCGGGIKPDIAVRLRPKNAEVFDKQTVELMGEFKADKGCDPFVDDSPDGVHSTTDKGLETLGQITSYATCHMGMHSRTHVFQFLVIADYARLLRWDRSGVVVTRKIDLNDKNLAEFFWRFDHLTDEERGWDTTVTVALSEEVKEAEAKLSDAELKLGKVSDGLSPRYLKISLGPGRGSYIVHSLSYAGTQSPFGRATRAFAAYSLQNKNVVFLKSTWRVVSETGRREDEIYQKLHEARVNHIPHVVEFWDVPEHVTKTQDAIGEFKKFAKQLRTLQHYILVLEELGRGLTSFKSSRELLSVLGDVAEGKLPEQCIQSDSDTCPVSSPTGS